MCRKDWGECLCEHFAIDTRRYVLPKVKRALLYSQKKIVFGNLYQSPFPFSTVIIMTKSCRSRDPVQTHSSLIASFFFFFFLLYGRHVRSLFPQPVIESAPLAVEAWSLNHWPTREFPRIFSKSRKQTATNHSHSYPSKADKVKLAICSFSSSHPSFNSWPAEKLHEFCSLLNAFHNLGI